MPNIHTAIRSIILGMVLFGGVAVAASEVSAVSYPIAELGNCRDQQECYWYCEVPRNKPACWAYGEFSSEGDVLGLHTGRDAAIESRAEELGIEFPVVELGGCESASECRAYCDVAENREDCVDFADQYNFSLGRHRGNRPGNARILTFAREELGCSSVSECRAVCDEPVNQSTCEEFGAAYGLKRSERMERVHVRSQELTELLMDVLSCESKQTCREACDENRSVCQEIVDDYRDVKRQELIDKAADAKQNRQRGSCDSDASCRAYCDEHPEECAGKLTIQHEDVLGASTGDMSLEIVESDDYLGPTGCDTVGACRLYCESMPGMCPSFLENNSSSSSEVLGVSDDEPFVSIYDDYYSQRFGG